MVYEVFAVSRGRGDGVRRAIDDWGPRRRARATNNRASQSQLTALSLAQAQPRAARTLVASELVHRPPESDESSAPEG